MAGTVGWGGGGERERVELLTKVRGGGGGRRM